jgi:hypothetical protein
LLAITACATLHWQRSEVFELAIERPLICFISGARLRRTRFCRVLSQAGATNVCQLCAASAGSLQPCGVDENGSH